MRRQRHRKALSDNAAAGGLGPITVTGSSVVFSRANSGVRTSLSRPDPTKTADGLMLRMWGSFERRPLAARQARAASTEHLIKAMPAKAVALAQGREPPIAEVKPTKPPHNLTCMLNVSHLRRFATKVSGWQHRCKQILLIIAQDFRMQRIWLFRLHFDSDGSLA